MEESFAKRGFYSLEEHIQGYMEIFLLLQKGEHLPELFEEKSRELEERERITEIFLPAVYLGACYGMTKPEYWVVMFSFCCEVEDGLCMDYRDKYKDTWPSLHYILHLLSQVMPVDFFDIAGLYEKNGVLQELLDFNLEEGEEGGRDREGILRHSLHLTPMVSFFLLTGELPMEEWYVLSVAGEGREMPKGEGLFPLHEKEYGMLCRILKAKEPLRILLYGRKGSGSHTLLRRVCTGLQANVLFVGMRELFHGSPHRRRRIRQGLRLLVRLTQPTVALELAEEAFGDSSETEWHRQVKRFLSDLGDSPICFLAHTQVQAGLIKEYADLCLSLSDTLTREEKRLALDVWVPKGERRGWQEELLENYCLNMGELKKRYRSINIQVRAQGGSLTDKEVWLEGIQDRQEALRFGKLVDYRCGQEDIVLSQDCEKQLEAVIRLAKAWRGEEGLRILFHGSSGTGKTMAASVLAAELRLPLFKVDLSQVFDKYIGETEKHMEEIFRTARRNHYLLFFDEADALFAKRTAVKDSHDKYANVSAAFLLQRMEDFDGMLILATNLKDHFDDAFVRRIRFVVKFRNLDKEGRERLWEKVLKEGLPAAGDVDYGSLAEAAELSPARISEAARVAKLLAACDGNGIVTKDHLREALALEAGKDETVIRRF